MQVSPPLRVLIVDDSADLRGMLRAYFQREGMEVVGMLESADALIGAAASQRPDVALVDLTMPGRDPLEAVRELAQQRPEVRIVVCSGYDDQATIDSAIEAGASGFVSKHADIDGIVLAVRRAWSGEGSVRR